MTTVSDFKYLTDIEHVRHRPDMFIGPIKTVREERWIVERSETVSTSANVSEHATKAQVQPRAEKKYVNYNPGLEQCVLELITNAADHAERCKSKNIKPLVNAIKVDIDDKKISVYNDGKSIPIEIHQDTKKYVPEMIFGYLRTSSNYDDSQKKTWGGKNGIGAKAANIFSRKFIVEVQSSGTYYRQVFSKGMTVIEPPSIEQKVDGDWIKITYYPDFKAFDMESFESNDTRAVIEKRCYDIAACNDVSVYLNKKKIPIKNFGDYMKLFIGPDEEKVVYKTDRWEIGIAKCPWDDPVQISFVNSISTDEGGTHVNHVLDPIIKEVVDHLSQKNKGVDIKKSYIKNNIIIFVKALIDNPSFSSQLKRKLETRATEFGSRCVVPEAIIKKILKLPITDNVVEIAKAHDKHAALKSLDTSSRKTVRVEKLRDARFAGHAKYANFCTLILTEGDSASSLAINGISALPDTQRDFWGVFPLKGKFLNIRTATSKQLMENEEMKNINTILGLSTGDPEKMKLRYGKVMLMSDQDSVTGDTPLLLRDPTNGQIVIKNIEDLSECQPIDGTDKLYGQTSYEVWSDKGWTKIKHVMKHLTDKQIYRVLSHTGCVDVTEDHSLLDEHGEKVAPKDVKVNGKLLHSFPLFNRVDIPDNFETFNVYKLRDIAKQLKLRYYQSIKVEKLKQIISEYKNKPVCSLSNTIDITPDEAWVIGLLMADGTCGYYKSFYTYKNKARPRAYTVKRERWQWAITNCDIRLLEKSKSIMEKIYGNYFTIIAPKQASGFNLKNQCYKLMLNGGKKIQQPIVEKYRMLCYYKKFKYIHPILLNSEHVIRENVFNGYYAGDGIHNLDNPMRSDINGKITTLCLYTLARSVGYEVSINHDFKKEKIYSLSFTKGTFQKDPIIIKKIIQLPRSEEPQYVYDLETENHHFQAGCGQTIVHNTDGFHIKGLLLNYFTYNWPKLVQSKFVECMITPIVKVFNKSNNKIVEMFYSLNDFEKWKKEKEDNNESISKYRTKYYKGLGTSTKEDAKSYFQQLDQNRIKYLFSPDQIKYIELAFDKEKADARKEWITEALRNPQEIDYNKKEVEIPYFINRELVQFSIYDNVRSVPNVIDGLKPSQRKILYTCLNRANSEIKVASLAGEVSSKTAYHHGEVSLQATIVNMAQDFVGSNNLNLLVPEGMFGTRIKGGSDASSARYIFTQLKKYTKIIFNEVDNKLLEYQYDDGDRIEPTYFVPIIPMLLVNGSKGIGTGWSTSIPCFNPKTIIQNIRLFIHNKQRSYDQKPYLNFIPWYRDYKGYVTCNGQSWNSLGMYQKISDTKYRITELPIEVWVEDYEKKVLDKDHIKSYTISNTDTNLIDIHVEFKQEPTDVVKELKLENSIPGTNLIAFDQQAVIQKYQTVNDIFFEFCEYRLEFYEKRRNYLLQDIKLRVEIAREKIRFVTLLINDELILKQKDHDDIIEEMTELGFKHMNVLLGMSITCQTKNEIEKLKRQIELLEKELEALEKSTKFDMWSQDLDDLENAIEEDERELGERGDKVTTLSHAKKKSTLKSKKT